ncbi:four helix bundle protein [Candidatus Peribacteria bacterium]|nr:four helix bundle protein [Candidatus Peribacteria bacterium]
MFHRGLDERTHDFGCRVRKWVRTLPLTPLIIDDIKQLIRSSGSVGANYIEANESLGKKDCGKCMKICRKEAKESGHWLRMLDIRQSAEHEKERQALIQESHELTCIFHSIITKYYS